MVSEIFSVQDKRLSSFGTLGTSVRSSEDGQSRMGHVSNCYVFPRMVFVMLL